MVKIQWLGQYSVLTGDITFQFLFFCYAYGIRCWALGISIVLVWMYLNLFWIWVRVHYDSAKMIHIIQSDSQPFMGHHKWLAWRKWNRSAFILNNSSSNIERHFDIIVSNIEYEKTSNKIKCFSIIAHSFKLTLSECCPKWTSYHLAFIYYAYI